jgi:hypothetical protein
VTRGPDVSLTSTADGPLAGTLGAGRAPAHRLLGRIVALCLLVGSLAYVVALGHGLIPRQLKQLSVTFAYTGLIECATKYQTFPDPVCGLLGLPVGFVPLTDLPYLEVAAAVGKVTGAPALVTKAITDCLCLVGSALCLVWLQRRLGVGWPISFITTATYLTSPYVLGHSQIFGHYIGVLMLPGYLLADYWFFGFFDRWRAWPGWARMTTVAVGYGSVHVIALFQDPYTAVMHAALSGTILIFAVRRLVSRRAYRPTVAVVCLWTLSMSVAIGLYEWHLPDGIQFGVMPIDFFRAQGVDVVSFFIPSPRLLWSRLAGVGVQWDSFIYYGDGLNVNFNYLGYALLVPTLVFVAVAVRRRVARGDTFRAAFWMALAASAVLGLLASLGPSLKVHDVRISEQRDRVEFDQYLMPGEAATLTLPTEALFASLPGIKHMRATYRWIALPKLILVLAFAMVASWLYERRPALGVALALIAFGEQVPDLPRVTHRAQANYQEFVRFNEDVLAKMSSFLAPGQRVFFLSGENDYLANYLAPMLEVATYNVGGDKNQQVSSDRWPQSLRELFSRALSAEGLGPFATEALASHEVDAIILPYFSLRWDAYHWPPGREKRDRRRLELLRGLDLPSGPLRFAESDWFGVVDLAGSPPELREPTAP